MYCFLKVSAGMQCIICVTRKKVILLDINMLLTHVPWHSSAGQQCSGDLNLYFHTVGSDSDRWLKLLPHQPTVWFHMLYDDNRMSHHLCVSIVVRRDLFWLPVLEGRQNGLGEPSHVINIDIQDNHEEATIGAFMICDLCSMVSTCDMACVSLN